MTTLGVPRVRAANDAIVLSRQPIAHLVALGTALPPLRWSSAEIQESLAWAWRLQGADLDRWRRIVAGSSVDARHAVLPQEQVMGLSTAQRMGAYERFAPELAANAAENAMKSGGIGPEEVTDLIVVSCTGFSAPGVDAALVRSLGLRPAVRRTMVGFMGCFGAISGLRTALGSCCADPKAVALVVCVELCSLHVRNSCDPQNLVACALFGDGAAAAIVRGDQGASGSQHGVSIGQLTSGASLLIEEGREWMTWRITDSGFAMTLGREVPMALRRRLGPFVREAYPGQRIGSYAVHPGGPGILDAAEAALQLVDGTDLAASRSVLRRIGNVSSATVLFVLDELRAAQASLPVLLLAFGPGLTIESMLIAPPTVR